MRWRLSDEQQDYQKSLRAWLADIAGPRTLRGWYDAADSAPFEARFVTDGWSGVGLPEALGGQGGGLVELALTAQELGRAAAPSSAWLASVLAAPAAGGTGAALLLPAETVPHLADPLPGTGVVVPRVMCGATTDRFVVPARENDGVVLRVVDGGSVQRTARHLLDRSRTAADVRLDGTPGDATDGDAPMLLREASARGAVLVAADALGASERMLEMAVAYAAQRRQFGVPIGSFQAVKHAAAQMLVGIEAARSVVYFAAASVDTPAGERDPQWLMHAAAAKSQVTAEAARAADTALTLHGAIGYTWEHDLQLFYKRAKLDAALLGRPATWAGVIADGLHLV
jgi:alkylation response protein AidB-like acyl-CoA dehydrogenase